MGLTIHYKLKSNAKSKDEARGLVESLRKCALKLPFKEVGDIVEFTGEGCSFNASPDEYKWLKIQSHQRINIRQRGRYISIGVPPLHIIAFTTWPGEGCEEANFGLCLYPGSTEHDGKQIPTKLKTGFTWKSFCKTQYASDPGCGGVKNFLKCHLAVISLLDHANSQGILKEINDEGGYWEKRNVGSLANEVGDWNGLVASFGGALKDALGESDKGLTLESVILKRPDFEHIEACFKQKNPKITDSILKTAQHIVFLTEGITA